MVGVEEGRRNVASRTSSQLRNSLSPLEFNSSSQCRSICEKRTEDRNVRVIHVNAS